MKSFKLIKNKNTSKVEIDGFEIKGVRDCEIKVACNDLPIVRLELVNVGCTIDVELSDAETRFGNIPSDLSNDRESNTADF